jgi:MOSC domain-containing protein YiiM
VRSVNIGRARRTEDADLGVTGIDKEPVAHAVEVRAPGPKGVGGSGLAGDTICSLKHHGGDDQAVYAVAREDLDSWQQRLGRELPDGMFGENLTTSGLDVTGALIGERWRIGDTLVLQVTVPRIPCRTFAAKMGVRGWLPKFTREARPGAYLRVVTPGSVRADDPIRVVHRPDHDVTIGVLFRAVTLEAELLPRVADVPDLTAETRAHVARRLGRVRQAAARRSAARHSAAGELDESRRS